MNIKFCYVALLICLILSGCSRSDTSTPTPSPESNNISQSIPPAATTPPFTQDPMSQPNFLETPIREFGESTAYIQMEEDLVVRILYPESGIPSLDETIHNWVKETVAEYQLECLGCHQDEDCGELTAEYESHVVSDRWVSIKISGIFDKPYLAHPIDIMSTFHADLQTGKLITLKDLLVPDGYSALANMVAATVGAEQNFIDDHFLDHWVLTSDGLEITLARGDYLPMSEGTKVLFYPYEDLEGILAFPKEAFPEQTPVVEPMVTPPAVSVSPSPETAPLDPSKPMVALTFDDGPSKHTSRLLDAFASHGGRGTFFVIGNILENRADVLNRMVSEGHEIGGHSWDHRQLTKLNTTDLNNELIGTRAKIHEITGVNATLLRPPYGSYNSQVKNMCKDLGIVMVNWSLDTLDWKYKDADRLYHTILEEVQDGDIILCHDLHGSTVDAMERVIPELIARGYQLVTVSELLDQRGDVIEAGEVYYRGE